MEICNNCYAFTTANIVEIVIYTIGLFLATIAITDLTIRELKEKRKC